MHEALLKKIRPVTRRLRWHQFRWMWVLIALIASAIGAALLSSVRAGRVDGYLVAGTLLVICAIGAVASAVIAFITYRNPRRVAVRIEQTFPNLKQRLLTVLSQTDPHAADAELGYLQRRVIQEAQHHARSHRWTDAAPRTRVWLSRVSGLLATACLVSVLAWLIASAPPPHQGQVASLSRSLPKVTVQPGNIELERGKSLVVTARFEDTGVDGPSSEYVPVEGDLLISRDDGSSGNVRMSKNLKDPVIGGFVASVDQSFQYQIATSLWQSEVYSVDVFEFPSLVRSDAQLIYPSYTGLDQKRVEDTVRVAAVQGTKLTWICHLNKPVETAELVDESGERISLVVNENDPKIVSAQLEMKETRRFKVALIDNQGRKNKFPEELVARVLPNQPTKLKLLDARDVTVSALEELRLAAEVRDDFGIRRAGIAYTFDQQPIKEIVLAKSIRAGQKQTIEQVIEFEELDAEPDQLLAYFFWAEDYGPNGDVRRTDSDMFFAEVRPFEEIFREGEPPPGGQPGQQSQNGQQAEELADLQKQIISATWNVMRTSQASTVDAEFADNVSLLLDSQVDAQTLLEKLAEKVRDEQSVEHVEQIGRQMEISVTELQTAVDESDASSLPAALSAQQAAYATLLKLRAREFQVTRQNRNQQSRSSSSSSQRQRQRQVDELELDQEENRYETQRQAEQTEQEQQQREVRQVLSRLRELARRQEDLNKQLAQLQSALEQAETQKEKKEIERQLKRLRDQQQELLRETDELSQRMQEPENQETMGDESEQLEQARENVRRASEALQQNDASQALSAGKRAEREFEQMRDEFRQKAAGQFNDAVREMRSDARELDQRQAELSKKLEDAKEDASPGLRPSDQRGDVEQDLEQQRERLSDLLQQMQQTVEEAEVAEPLLAKNLYDSYRKTRQRQVEQRLSDTAELVRRGFTPEAREIERQAAEGIGQLKEDLEQAASSVLGDETEALQRALSELEQLERALDQEIRQNDPQGSSRNQRGSNSSEDSRQSNAEPNSSSRERSETEPNPGEPSQNGRQPSDERDPSQRPQSDRQGSQQDQQPPDERTKSDRRESDQSQSPQRAANESDEEQGEPGRGRPQSGQSEQNQSSPSESPQGQTPQGRGSQTSSNEPQSQPASDRSGQPASDRSGQPASDRSGQPASDRSGQPASDRSGQPTSDRSGQPDQGSLLNQFAAEGPNGSPLTGEGFRDWSDRLRDVEEMVDDPELRSEAARIRDRARDVRLDYRRHSKEPNWRLVDDMIAKPLRELKRDVQEELMRRSAEKHAKVPIDRDPVPQVFSDAVRRYYESLGSGR